MRTLFRILFSAALLLLGIALLGRTHAEAAPLWSLDEAKSEVGFVAKQTGAAVNGVFEDYDADIIFDPADLEGSRIHVEIKTASVNTRASDRDKLIRSDAFFAAKDHPVAIFEAKEFANTGDNNFVAHGTLTLRGVTKEVDLPFTATVQDDVLKAAGATSVSRLEFGVGQGQWLDTAVVGEMVEITFDIEGKAKP